MKRILLAALVAASMVPAVSAFACKDCDCKHDKMGSAETSKGLKNVTVAEVAKLHKAGTAQLLDANTAEFRAKNGIIPGAKLLTSAGSYDVAKELPAAKNSKLVFYCVNARCLASHEAAERAVAAGYTDVSVMRDGLLGWKAAGQPTAAAGKI